MTLIPYPDVPMVSGVPSVPRVNTSIPPEDASATIPPGAMTEALTNSLQSSPQWGIFPSVTTSSSFAGTTSTTNVLGNALGASSDSTAVLSTYDVTYIKEMRISDFPIERGGFASYNKVEMPGNPKVTLILNGTEDDRAAFLTAVDAACKSTQLYSVVTPEATYMNVSLETYTYPRTAIKGANLLIVEISLKEIRPVSASYTTVATPINDPQSPSAAPQTDNGMVQSPKPDVSTAKQIVSILQSLLGAK
jgi:hypothetical protein